MGPSSIAARTSALRHISASASAAAPCASASSMRLSEHRPSSAPAFNKSGRRPSLSAAAATPSAAWPRAEAVYLFVSVASARRCSSDGAVDASSMPLAARWWSDAIADAARDWMIGFASADCAYSERTPPRPSAGLR